LRLGAVCHTSGRIPSASRDFSAVALGDPDTNRDLVLPRPFPPLWRLVGFLLQFILNIMRRPAKRPFRPASGGHRKKIRDSVAPPSHRPRSLALQRISLPRNATKWGVARLQFRGLKNRQSLETVARPFPPFPLLSFSFSLIFKGKKERSRDGGHKWPCGVFGRNRGILG